MLPARIELSLPDWVATLAQPGQCYPSDEAKLELAIALAAENVRRGSGGPFGAAVFDAEHRLLAAGVNQVVAGGCSLAHAETMALMLAQQACGRFRLNQHGQAHTLATSAQPCCQCYGATVWAGIDHLLIGARAEDVMRLTDFDEGPLPADWMGELSARGIQVRRDILRAAACAPLASYAAQGPNY